MMRTIATITVIISMVVHPVTYSHSQALPDALSPCPVSAGVPMTDGDNKFSDSVIRDAQFLSFAIFAYKTVITDGSDVETFFAKLAALPFWGDFRFKSYLAKEFISVKGDILTIKLRGRGVIRIASSATHKMTADGSLEDGVVPKAFYGTEGYLIQYIGEAVPPAGQDPGTQDSGDTGAPMNMIGFGPVLSYRALRMSDEMKGIYIAVAEEKVERLKTTIGVSGIADISQRAAAKLMENGLFTAEQVIEAGDEKLTRIFGPMTAARMLAACNAPQYVDHFFFVCRTEEWAGRRAKEIAEMLNQALFIINSNKDYYGSDPIEKSLSNVLKDMAGRLRGRKIDVEVAENLEANSACYPRKIVFNKDFIDFLYDRWISHRVEGTAAHWNEEMGALVMLAERLFHEMDHDPDEVRQILLDRLYYKATLNDRKSIKEAVRYDVSFQVKSNGGGKVTQFGECFGTNAYFAMIHRIAGMDDANEIKRVTLEYLENIYRSLSKKEALNLRDAQISFAAKLLKERGISDGLFGETLFGKGFDDLLKEHCLFSPVSPYNCAETDIEQQRRCSELYRRSVEDIKDIILSVGRSIGKEEETARWMANRLGMKHIMGLGSVKKKLYPIIKWVAAAAEPQNFQMRKGKLFGRMYYRGLNLMTLPIFPVGDDGEIRWELFRFDEEYHVWDASKGKNVIVRAPPKEYYSSSKISLYEYVVTHDIAEPADEEYVQMALPFDDGPDYENGAIGDNFPPVVLDGEYRDAVRGNITEIHACTMRIDVSPTIDKVTHILVEKGIPADSQQDILTFVNKRSREALVAEKVYFMDTEEINAYLAANRCGRDNTVVLLSDQASIEKVKADVNMLVVRKDGITDFVNIEGLIGAARCVLNRDWDAFRGIYKALTGSDCPEIRPEWLANPAELARQLIITLPPVSIINMNEQKIYNEMLREALVAA